MKANAETRSFDYVIVGAGSAGCIVAARLAENPDVRVLLLEAGGTDETVLCRAPGMFSLLHLVPSVKKRFDWGYRTEPQRYAANRRIHTVRGKVLGGSSAINGMVFVRGHRSNYDDWAASGCPGWSYDDVLPSFKRLEDWEGGASEHRGAGGPIAVTCARAVTPASEAFVAAVAAACDVPLNNDYNGPAQLGATLFQMSARGGRRYSASEGYLRHAPRNLTIRTGVTVSRIVIERGRATAVQILGDPEPGAIRAEREIILAAGVIGSAHLLMLSGIGPAAQLREHGIGVVADLPVGSNLHDHVLVPMTFLAPAAVHRSNARHFFSGMVAGALGRDTWFNRTVFEGVGFVRTPRACGGVPDLQLHSLPWSYPSPNQDAPVIPTVDGRPALTVMPTHIYPKSRGEIRLASADVTVPPRIDPHYLEEPEDRRFLIEAIQLVREIMSRQELRGIVTEELHPGGAFKSDDALAREIPNRLHTVYHPVGTCRMGSDERAVVDPELRVRGIEALRVADASVMPCAPGGNTNAPAMMIGERCAALLAGGARGMA